MPAYFEADDDDPDLDTSEDSPWLIIPANSKRKVWLRDSTGYDSFQTNKSFLSIPHHIPPGPDRQIELTAKNTPIATFLQAKNKKGDTVNLQVQILAKQQVKVSFFFVTDTGGQRKTNRTGASVTSLVRSANEILTPQTNVEIVPSINLTPYNFKQTLGPQVNGSPVPTRQEFADVVNKSAKGADLTVFFVWDLAGGADGGEFYRPQGSLPSYVLMKDNVGGQDARVLAHEVGHYLLPEVCWKETYIDGKGHLDGQGHSQDTSHLMWCDYQLAQGAKIPRNSAVKMNETAAR